MTTSKKTRSIARIDVVGADANNLKAICVQLPSPGVTLLMGASGSGKSSLLSDTLAIEGGRRREAFLGVRGDEGAAVGAWIGPTPPALHVGQRAFRATSRTTVATATGLLARLRRLFDRHAQPWADPPNEPVPAPNAEDWAGWLTRHRRGDLTIWAVPVRFQATDGVRAVKRLRDHGVEEVVVRSETDRPSRWEKGRLIPTRKFKALDPTVKHILEAHIGGMKVRGRKDESKLHELLRRAFDAGAGKLVVELPGETRYVVQGPFGPRLDSTIHLLHPESPAIFLEPNRHLLSFNAPEHPQSGACRACMGTGREMAVDLNSLVVDPKRSMHGGAFALWTKKNYRYVNIQHETIQGLSGRDGFDPHKPWAKLTESARSLILQGADNPVTDVDLDNGKKLSSPRAFRGFAYAIMHRITHGSKATAARLAEFVHEGACQECGGTRWSQQARALRVGSLDLHRTLEIPFDELPELLAKSTRGLPTQARALVDSIAESSRALRAVGLGHITGSRGMTEVSSGESRRLRLAGALNSPLDGLFILLDEPARGLHEADIAGLATVIRSLSAAHTIVVSDHRRGLLAAVDHVVDMGEHGGDAGGSIQYSGPPKPNMLVGDYSRRKSRASSERIEVREATIHNLLKVDIDIPVGCLTCVTGVSGSGKSSFIRGALVPGLVRTLSAKQVDVEDFELHAGFQAKVRNHKQITSLVALDQKNPPPNRRSLVLTFMDVATTLRNAFAKTPQAQFMGMKSGDFGLNSGEGRCERCLGLGEIEGTAGHISPCPRCGGARFGPQVLAIEVDNLTMTDFLQRPFSTLIDSGSTSLRPHLPVLRAACDLGLGYLTLGRRVDTLSGGEVQRLRIARSLVSGKDTGTLFVLDEPAAGLHPVDVGRLQTALDHMLQGGRNTVVLVEHNVTLIAAADYIIDFGPAGGPRGGKIVAKGSPAQVAKKKTPTGLLLAQRHSSPRALPKPPNYNPGVPDAATAQRARTWLRLLIGDDVEPPFSDESRVQLAASMEFKDKAVWELGQLDHELALFILERSTTDGTAEAKRSLLDTWNTQPAAILRIAPYLDEIQTWGPKAPRSATMPVDRQIEAFGLRMDTNALGRATGGILSPANDSRAARQAALREGLAIGAGYAELVDQRGRPLANVCQRPLDLEHNLVGPMQPAPAHLLRGEALGACRMCTGSRFVSSFEHTLVIGKKTSRPSAEDWLRPEAMAILRGVRRATLLPFLQRMDKEGLFDARSPYHRLSEQDRQWLIFGYWRRLGHGTFVKPRKNPAEVGSWLRWDGLYRHLAAELERTKDRAWREKLEESRRLEPCPNCRGTGLGETAELFFLGGTSLRELVRTGTVENLYTALEGEPKLRGVLAKRNERRRLRLLRCLKPAMRLDPKSRLNEPTSPESAKLVAKAVVHTFTTMPII